MQKSLNTLRQTDYDFKPLKNDGIFGTKTQYTFNKFWNDNFADEENHLANVAQPSKTKPQMSFFAAYSTPKVSEERKRKETAKKSLNEILDKQYPITKTVELSELTGKYGANEKSADYAATKNDLGLMADKRMKSAFSTIDKYKVSITAAAKEFGIPSEEIGSIILKEQYTESLPDWLANITTFAGKEMPFLIERTGGVFGKRSTGAGAIFPDTARLAWERYLGKEQSDRFLPKDDRDLQVRLSENTAFNIRSIALVLANKAFEEGIIESYQELGNVSPADMKKILAAHNGSGDAARKYSNNVLQYLPYMREYLK